MKVAYAFRRGTLYPHQDSGIGSKEHRSTFLKKAKEIGFDGIELGASVLDQPNVESLRAELENAGLPCVAIRGGGGFTNPRTAAGTNKRWAEIIHFAAQIGAGVVNSTVGGVPAPDPRGIGTYRGERISQGSSRTAREEDYEQTARGISEAAKVAADHGLQISIEIHQQSIVDNSWSALHLIELVDAPNVGINPDLGNIYWTYDIPEESCEDAIAALAPHCNYWHCKNLYRVHIPDLEKSILLQAPIPDGDIDYRFAISAMLAAGYNGYLAIEGMRLGDQFHNDGKSVAYVKSLIEALSG
jgi:sugar phosphate isomerase/epimerase